MEKVTMSIYLCYRIDWDLDGATPTERSQMSQITIGSFELDEEEEAHEEGVGYVLADKLCNRSGWCVLDLSYCKVADDDEERFCAAWERSCP